MTVTDTEPRSNPAPNQPHLVLARGLKKGYGSVRVLDDVTFTVEPGITGLLGANGSGKTTVLGLVLGLHPIEGGSLEVLGQNPWTAGSAIRTRIGYAPEHHTLPPDLRAADFVKHVAELHGIPPEEAKTRASDALWLVDLGEERFRPMGTMSTGQRQRVKLAQAIAHDPEFVLLDEPTDGLDPTQREVMLDLIASLSSEFNMNIVLSSHLIDEVERVCDRVIIIGDGVTMAEGTVNELQGTSADGIVAEIDADAASVEQLAAHLAALDDSLLITADGRRLYLNSAPAASAPDSAKRQTSETHMADLLRDACIDLDLGLIRLEQRSLRLEDVFLEHLR